MSVSDGRVPSGTTVLSNHRKLLQLVLTPQPAGIQLLSKSPVFNSTLYSPANNLITVTHRCCVVEWVQMFGSVSCSLCFRELHYLWNIPDLCPLPHLPPGALLRMWQAVPLLPWESQPPSNGCQIVIIFVVIIIPKQDQSQVRISLLVGQYQVTVHSRILH